ncbi:hypothetical protein HanIR_Chr16g0827721 [Helianthus annuus]|nr:hypothetical protein HanIR_Chr16g0827721 [Helianthus annuus]
MVLVGGGRRKMDGQNRMWKIEFAKFVQFAWRYEIAWEMKI